MSMGRRVWPVVFALAILASGCIQGSIEGNTPDPQNKEEESACAAECLHGECIDAQCICEPGYAGLHCESCALGYQDIDGDGTCDAPVCGNDVIESGEQCDNSSLAQQTCQTQGFDEGTLSCSSCSFDTSDCLTMRHLVQEGAPVADIVVAPDAPNMVALAAGYFQQYIEDMTGATLQLGNSPDAAYDFHVYIGSSQYTDDLGITAEGTRDGGFKMVSGQDYLVLLGNDTPLNEDRFMSDSEWDALTSPDKWLNTHKFSRSYHDDYDVWEQDDRGTMNAVHEFLGRQGMRWYYPNGFGTVIPNKQDIAFASLNELVNPDMPMRHAFLYYKTFGHLSEAGLYPVDAPHGSADDHFQWVMSLGLNTREEYISGLVTHGLNAITSREENKLSHPEYYAVWNGTLMNGDNPKQNLCSQELLEAAIRYVKLMFDTYDASYVSIWPADGFTRVSEHSPQCLATATPERGYDGQISDYVWDFVNEVAWAIADDPNYGPDRKVICGAYTAYQLPPLTPSDPRGMAPNIAIFFTRWRTWSAEPEQKQYYQDLIDEWLNILPSREIFTYDYYLHNRVDRSTESLPVFFPHLTDDDLKFLNGKSRGEYIEILTNWPGWNLTWDTFAAQSLNTWITARLYWDTSQSVDALLNEYYELYYGPASAKMKQLHEYSENNYSELNLNPIYLNTMRGLAQEALAAVAGDSVYAQRINNLLGLMNSSYVGAELEVSSCQELTSPGTTYKLSGDISAADSCFFINQNGITIDCQGHTITYGTGGGSDAHAVNVEARTTSKGHYYTIRNCGIADGGSSGRAIYIRDANHGVIQSNNINVSGGGIGIWGSVDTIVRANTVSSGGEGLYAQYGGSEGTSLVSANTIEDNVFTSSSGFGSYLYRIDSDRIINNEFRSSSSNGLRLYYPVDVLLQDNFISSDSASGLHTFSPTNLESINNTIVDG